MSKLLALIKALLPSVASQKERDDADLTQAVGFGDFERHMRNLDYPATGLRSGASSDGALTRWSLS